MSDEGRFRIRINATYAAKYEEKKRKEELSRLKDKYGEIPEESESSSSESEDEVAMGVTAQNNQDFLRTLSLIKANDTRIRDPSYKFYQSESESIEDGHSDSASETKKKPLYLRDYERKRLEEKGSLAFVSSDEEDEHQSHKQASHLVYDKEQRELRESLKQSIAEVESEEEGDEPLLQVRRKTVDEQEKEDEDYIQWLGGKEASKLKKREAEDMNALRRYWTDPNLNENERFLRDYILHKGHIDKEANRIPSYDELVCDHHDDEDEDEVEKQEEFERKYNFRFEEPGAATIVSHPRIITDSVRHQDDSRKIKRKKRLSRKAKEKEEKREELKRLKNLKRKEIEEKLEKLKETTGNATVGFEAEDIERDFDPDEYDEMMQSAFNEDFYSHADELHEKPVFSDERWGDMEQGNDEDWDEWQGNDHDAHVDDPDFNMDADFDPVTTIDMDAGSLQEIDKATTGYKKSKKSRFSEAVRRKKPTFNPDEKKFEEYFEEFYQLDYEDIVAGQPCRFKYRKVTPNDFGLSIEEMLTCEKQELNRWASLKRVVQYKTDQEEARDVKKYKRKGSNCEKKLQLLPSLQQAAAGGDKSLTSNKHETHTKMSRKDKKQQQQIEKKKRRKTRQQGDQVGVSHKISHSRLTSYGLHAKKFKRST